MSPDSARSWSCDTTVRQWMIHNPYTVETDLPTSEALRRMRLHRVQHLPVLRDGELVGMVCDRDLDRAMLRRAIPGNRDPRLEPRPTLVDEVMRIGTTSVRPDATLEEAAQRMLLANQSALPVVDEAGHLVGLISAVDLLCAAFGVTRSAQTALN